MDKITLTFDNIGFYDTEFTETTAMGLVLLGLLIRRGDNWDGSSLLITPYGLVSRESEMIYDGVEDLVAFTVTARVKMITRG